MNQLTLFYSLVSCVCQKEKCSFKFWNYHNQVLKTTSGLTFMLYWNYFTDDGYGVVLFCL